MTIQCMHVYVWMNGSIFIHEMGMKKKFTEIISPTNVDDDEPPLL